MKVHLVRPLNLEEARHKFLADPSVSPVFRYSVRAKDIKARKEEYERRRPSDRLFSYARAVLDKVMSKYGTESRYLDAAWGDAMLRPEEVDGIVARYLRHHGLEQIVEARWKANAVAPTSMASNVLTLSGPYQEHRIHGVLAHEVGTHFLRRYNGEILQRNIPTIHGKHHRIAVTEEGLAALNTHIYAQIPYLYQPALTYYAAWQATRMSFAELYADLAKYVDDPVKRWRECVRVKRGLEFTGRPGGYGKDQVYLEGCLALLQNRRKLDFVALHGARFTLEEYDVVVPLIDRSPGRMIVPQHIQKLDEYLEKIEIIARANNIP